MADTDRIMADFEKKLTEVQQRGEQVRDGLAGVTVTERTADGQITVTVNASGNLVDLKLAPSTADKPRPDLAEDIMRTLRRAQSKLAGAAHEAMPALAGTESMAELDRQYRTLFPELPPEPTRRRTLRFGAEGDPSPPVESATRRARPGPAEQNDEPGEFGDRNLLR